MRRSPAARSSGFTLIELLVVMGMFALTLTVVAFARPRNAALRLQTEAQTLVRELARARDLAVMTNSEVVVLVDANAHRVIKGRASRNIPADMRVVVTIADKERSGQVGGFRFYPDGQASGGEVVLALDHRNSRISVNWLTGQPRLVQ